MLNQKCPARIYLTENSGKATLRGCLAHNHPDNPTMKKIPWVTKRQIAKHLVRFRIVRFLGSVLGILMQSLSVSGDFKAICLHHKI